MDHSHSLGVEEFEEMVRDIHCLEAELGTGLKVPVEAERPVRNGAQRGIFAAVDISRGTVVTREMLKIVRLYFWLEPRNLDLVIGRAAQTDIPTPACPASGHV